MHEAVGGKDLCHKKRSRTVGKGGEKGGMERAKTKIGSRRGKKRKVLEEVHPRCTAQNVAKMQRWRKASNVNRDITTRGEKEKKERSERS